MSPRSGRRAAKLRSAMVLGAGLLTGLAITVLGQACFPGCDDVDPVPLISGLYERVDTWGDIAPHAREDHVRLHLDKCGGVLTAEFGSDGRHYVEIWELGPIEPGV